MLLTRGAALSPAAQAGLLAAAIGGLAALLRIPGLAGTPPGFRTEEATTALMAERVQRDNLPIFFGHEQDALPPFFPYVVRMTGTLAGWDVAGPRLAAALCGIAVAVFCALWLARARGLVWGLLGGLLAATSFWQLMFSRQALAPISSALFAALGLWLAWIALTRGSQPQPQHLYRRSDLPWYICAGAAFGFGFLTHPSYAVVPPLVLLTTGVLAGNQLRARIDADALGPALLLLAMVVAMTPLASHFLDQPEDFRRTLDLAAGLPDDLANTGDDVAAGLRGLVWRGVDDAAMNLPGRPILDPLLALWAALGLLAALRHPTRALEGTLLIWSVFGVFAVGLIGGADPSLYLPLAPVLIGLPIIGMHAAWQFARHRRQIVQLAAGALIAVSALASAGWSLYDYFWQWTDAPETYVALRGDVRAALEALEQMPDDDIPIYFAAGDAGRISRYLAPERAFHAVESRDQLALAFADDVFLIIPRSTQPAPQLRAYLAEAELVDSGAGPGGDINYRIWFAGPRTRDALPYAIPSIPFANGWLLTGYEAHAGLTPRGAQPEIEVILLWQVPPDADPFEAEVRLLPPGDPEEEFMTATSVAVTPWKAPQVAGGELLLVYAQLPFPRTGDFIASLQIGLRDPATGELVTPLLNAQDDGYAFLNDLQIVVP